MIYCIKPLSKELEMIDHRRIQINNIHQMMGKIEDTYNKCFHEIYPELQEQYEKVCDEVSPRGRASLNNKLSKIIDSFNSDISLC